MVWSDAAGQMSGFPVPMSQMLTATKNALELFGKDAPAAVYWMAYEQ